MITEILYFILFILLASAGYAGLRGAPWVPTRKKDVERFLKLVEIKPGQKFYDLGCGDGRLVIAAAKEGANAVGLEISIAQYLHAKINNFFAKTNTQIKLKDLWNVNLSDADIVYIFLLQDFYPKLKAKLEKELKPGATIIIHAWPMPGWQPIKVDTAPNSLPIYLYQR